MSQVTAEATAPETTPFSENSPRFGDLRGVRWRIDLGVLPSFPSASVDDLRRATANSRRRYASLRRQLLIDQSPPKDGTSSPDVAIDNPLSQNPDSMWGRFFKNAELEKMVDQDLTRLYPERFDYFQTDACQVVLRRILLLWCLKHPEYGYRQGMHELLAPLLYVLHADVKRLQEVKSEYADHFADKFDGFSFHENDFSYKFDFKKHAEDGDEIHGRACKNVKTPMSSDLQRIFLLSDAYGAEGELGVVLSEKFMEHDAYSLFDALMIGSQSAISMAGFFSPSPLVIEASAAIYHLLSVADGPLHSHLVELGVEPQYFALRWLRVLFGREFSLGDLLCIWDEIFSREDAKSVIKRGDEDAETNFAVLNSPRGSFVAGFAVSMILYLRSSLLSTEISTACLQRLLNFPEDVELAKVIEKAKSLQDLASEVNCPKLFSVLPLSYGEEKKKEKKPAAANRGHSLSVDSSPPKTPLSFVPESYWEEKWRVLHNEEDKKDSNRVKGWASKVKLRLSRTESDPSHSNKNGEIKVQNPPVRRNLLDDLRKQLGEDEHEIPRDQDSLDFYVQEDAAGNNLGHESEKTGNNLSVAQIPNHGSSDFVGTVASNSSSMIEHEAADQKGSPLPISDQPDDDDDVSDEASSSTSNCSQENGGPTSKCSRSGDSFSKSAENDRPVDESTTENVEDKKFVAGKFHKFQWLWRFGRNSGEVASEKQQTPREDSKATSVNGLGRSIDEASNGEATVDQNMLSSLKSIGQSMLENIQVIESVFQQENVQKSTAENLSKNGIVGKGQITATAALTELRKISNLLLSEM